MCFVGERQPPDLEDSERSDSGRKGTVAVRTEFVVGPEWALVVLEADVGELEFPQLRRSISSWMLAWKPIG